MPIKSAKQFGLMGAAMKGKIKGLGGPSAPVAKEFMDKTPKMKKKSFAQALKSPK